MRRPEARGRWAERLSWLLRTLQACYLSGSGGAGGSCGSLAGTFPSRFPCRFSSALRFLIRLAPMLFVSILILPQRFSRLFEGGKPAMSDRAFCDAAPSEEQPVCIVYSFAFNNARGDSTHPLLCRVGAVPKIYLEVKKKTARALAASGHYGTTRGLQGSSVASRPLLSPRHSTHLMNGRAGTRKAHCMSAGKKSARRRPLAVKRLPVTFASDNRRVITRFFDPGSQSRIRNIFERVAQLSDDEVGRLLDEVFQRFRTRHLSITARFEQNYANASTLIGWPHDQDVNRRLLSGSYFTMEYSIESAALFNPSIVPHLNQQNLPDGAVRFIMSLRNRRGPRLVDCLSDGRDLFGLPNSDGSAQPFYASDQSGSRQALRPGAFSRKLKDIRVPASTIESVMSRVGDSFTMVELENAVAAAQEAEPKTLRAAR